MERAPDLATTESGIGGTGALAGPVDLPRDDRVERRVVALGARDKKVQQLKAADAAVANLAGEAGCRGEGALFHVSSLPFMQNGTLTARSQRNHGPRNRQ